MTILYDKSSGKGKLILSEDDLKSLNWNEKDLFELNYESGRWVLSPSNVSFKKINLEKNNEI